MTPRNTRPRSRFTRRDRTNRGLGGNTTSKQTSTKTSEHFLKLDVAELESLLGKATRQKVKDILIIETRKLVTEIVKLEEQQQSAPVTTPSSQATAATKNCYQVKLNNYAWDQTNKFVKFYVTLKNVQSLPVENVSCSFTGKSLEMTVKNLDGKDYVLTIKNLLKSIDPATSVWKTKSDMVIVSAAKVDPDKWSHVTELEKRASDAKKVVPDMDKNGDPSDGLMSIMKNMYEQGDDEMKRTIAKAWTESQNKGAPSF